MNIQELPEDEVRRQQPGAMGGWHVDDDVSFPNVPEDSAINACPRIRDFTPLTDRVRVAECVCCDEPVWVSKRTSEDALNVCIVCVERYAPSLAALVKARWAGN